MFKKLAVSLGVLALVGAGVFYYGKNSAIAPKDDVASQPQLRKANYSWHLEAQGVDSESSAPKTKVMLVDGNTHHTIGVYEGNCSEIAASSWQLLENEESGVICWWAGGGTEAGVFLEDGKRNVKVGTIEEGSAEAEGFRGNFKTVLTLR